MVFGGGSVWYSEVEVRGILEVELAQNRRVLMCLTVGIRLRVFGN